MNAVQRLKDANMRTTQNRIAILELIEEHDEPMSHAEILGLLDDSFDRVTLYRILDAFVEKRLIHRVQGTDGTWRFCSHDIDAESCPGGHAHFLCDVCGKMTCLPQIPMPHVTLDECYIVNKKQFLITGICPSCRIET